MEALASQHIPINSTAPLTSILALPASRHHGAVTASPQSDGCRQPLSSHLLGNPFHWLFSSDAARDVSVPLGQKYTSALFQTKRYLSLLFSQRLQKIVFKVSVPSPHMLFEKQNISDSKSCHQSHIRTKAWAESHKSGTSSHTGKLPVELLLQKTSKPRLRAPSPSKPFSPQGYSPQQNPGVGTKSSRFPAHSKAKREE